MQETEDGEVLDIGPLDFRSSRGALPVESSPVDYRSRLQHLESASPCLNAIHTFLSTAVLFLSATSAFVDPSTLPPVPKLYYRTLALLSLSPESLTPAISQTVLLCLVALLAALAAFQLSIPLRELSRRSVGNNFLNVWLYLFKIVYPLPSLVVGANFGHFFLELTNSTATLRELLLSISCWVLHAWSITTTVSALHHKVPPSGGRPVQLAMLVLLLPALHSALPCFLAAFGDHHHPVYAIVLSSLVAIVVIVFLTINRSYRTLPNFLRFGTLSIVTALLSALWSFAEHAPAYIPVYLGACLLFALVLAVAFLLCPLPATPLPAEPPSLSPLAPVQPRRWPWTMFSFERQDFFCAGALLLGLLTMTLMNAFAATRMPLSPPLPDIVHGAFPVAATLRSGNYGSFQFSNIGCFVLAGSLIVANAVRPENTSVRKVAIIWAAVAFLRSFAFTLTGLPAPCGGLGNCPCADPDSIAMLSRANPLKMALIWALGCGVWLPHPQCGDLIVSGHTLFLWLFFRGFQDFVGRTFREPFGRLLLFPVAALTAASMAFIVIARNHYGVDVYFGWLLTEMLWQAYRVAEAAAQRPADPKEPSFVKFVRWIEIRTSPITPSRQSSDIGA
jgi:hypothetical protein